MQQAHQRLEGTDVTVFSALQFEAENLPNGLSPCVFWVNWLTQSFSIKCFKNHVSFSV